MNPSNDALVQQMLQQNQMLMQMVLAQQPGALQQVQPVVPPQPPLAVPQPAAQPELRQVEPEEREEILPQDVRPFEPIKYDQFTKLTPAEVMRYLQMTDRYGISHLPLKPKGGSLFLINSEGDVNSEDFRSCGYRMKLINGGRIIGKTILVRDSHLIRPDCKVRGTKDFQMRTYVDSRQPGVALVHFIGDETLAVEKKKHKEKT